MEIQRKFIRQANINYRAIIKILGFIIFLSGAAMLIPWTYAAATHNTVDTIAFAKSAIPSILIGGFLMIYFKSTDAKFKTRDGYLVVALCWVVASFVGTFPYYFSLFTTDFIDAFFESTSGFTTTGCTAVSNGELTGSLLLWKALSHWLGGMGILVFALSILPALGINGQFIAKAETPGPIFEKMSVRLSDTTRIMYLTYIILTLIEFTFLVLSPKMGWFDALVNSLGSISTGGLMVHSEGVAFYDSVYVEVVISVFCILSSINFLLYNYIRSGNWKRAVKDIELRAFLCIIAAGVLICTLSLMSAYNQTFPSALRDAFFQVVSISTTTGYVRSPYHIWPSTCLITLIILMFIGGCGGSTSGSLKVIRVVVMFKLIVRGTYKKIHPRSVVPVKVGDRILSAPIVSGISGFILTYLAIFIFGSLVISLQGLDMQDTIGTTLGMLSNTGTGIGTSTSNGSFAIYSPGLKLFLCLLMFVGRLEIFTILTMFTKHFWDRTK